MLNLSRLNPRSIAGRLFRLPLRALQALPERTTIRIVQGPLRGYRWTIASSVHGCWLGTYEAERQQKIASVLKPGMTFFDIGAHVGFFTLLGAHYVSPYGQVFAFEPSPHNTGSLTNHLAMNEIKHATVIQAAVSDYRGTMRFDDGHSRETGHLSEQGNSRVQSVTLDSLWNEGAIPLPDAMKIDVEGAEYDVLKGAREVLRTAKPAIFLETHGERPHSACLSFLRGLDYRCEEAKDEIVAAKA